MKCGVTSAAKRPRWLWHTIDHQSGAVLAYVFGRHQETVFLGLKQLLEPFGITLYDTDDRGAYQRHLDPGVHGPGKRYTSRSNANPPPYEPG